MIDGCHQRFQSFLIQIGHAPFEHWGPVKGLLGASRLEMMYCSFL